ncbi:translesion error-prone DNA polymerase V autoproteolytic subunit [soil metagenome]
MSSIDEIPDGVRVSRHAATSSLPVKGRSVAFGYGSGADDAASGGLDLNEALIRNAQATFVMKASGAAMRDAGIDDGDMLLVDRAVKPVHGHVIVAIVEGELLCRRLHRRGKEVSLEAANADVETVPLKAGESIELWGVVTTVIKRLVV